MIYLLAFICASCAWVKNEGLVFFILFTIGFLFINYKNKPVLKKYLIGLIIPILVVGSFKLFFSPANDLVAANNNRLPHLASYLFDLKRYITILKFAATTITSNYMIVPVLIFIVAIFKGKFFLSFSFIIVILLLAAYFLVYLLTPYDLNWHLSTSLSRILQHVFPALIYLLVLALKEVKYKPVLTI